MSDILEPKSIVNKANENIELVEFDEFINNINKYEIKIVSHEASILQEIDLPIDLDLFSFIDIP